MESSSSGDVQGSFMQQMLRNKMLMLTVFLAIGAAAYLVIGLFMMLT